LVCARSTLKTAMARKDGHHDLQLGEEVASTTPHVSRRPTFRVARAAPQRAAARASVAQSVPPPNGPLMAAREWLRNPLVKRPRPTPRGNGMTTSTAYSTWHRLPHVQRGGGGVCHQATPSSGWRNRFCALTISEECTNRGPPGGAQPQMCGRGRPCLH
jgi:hypothetical protein